MLDNGTKKRIDSARDILVGKVPDPKSQVEQITIALIYKFMDDMDNQTEEIGGKATFFAGEFKQYAWSCLLDRKFSGYERLLLYAEGIEKMNMNENIPQLFRDIFKGAFLPYRDPETLNLFLKEINGFNYDHSERLGDAFEYLLSVLSSQGDAGQFRTPRHIIDFIVEIVNPAKEDTVLDPACGTAGFLISSYKHILRQNTKDRPGDLLTTDDKGRLMTNFCGYDISPDMVRLSLVNMYLHSFAKPSIYEYDTLTSEDRWDERYDVIMANPPFMSPKGGIRPHSRFTVKAKRSEVLFESIVEGKGFEFNEVNKAIVHSVTKEKIAESGDYSLSGDRYKGVISYANVKWPMVELKSICDVRDGTHDSPKYQQKGFPLVTSKNVREGEIDFSTANLISKEDLDKINKRSKVDDGDIIMPMIGTIGNPILVKKDREFAIKNVALVKFYEDSKINRLYLKLTLESEALTNHYLNRSKGSSQKFISLGFIRDLQIPLPPIEVQEKIVAELDGYQKIIDGAKQIVENYKPTIKIDPDWPLMELGEVTTVTSSKRIFQNDYVNSGVPFYRTKEIVELSQEKPISLELYISKGKYHSIKEQFDVPRQGDILISAVGTIGISWMVSDNREFYFKPITI